MSLGVLVRRRRRWRHLLGPVTIVFSGEGDHKGRWIVAEHFLALRWRERIEFIKWTRSLLKRDFILLSPSMCGPFGLPWLGHVWLIVESTRGSHMDPPLYDGAPLCSSPWIVWPGQIYGSDGQVVLVWVNKVDWGSIGLSFGSGPPFWAWV